MEQSTETTTIGNASAALALADSSTAEPASTPQTETPAPTATTSAAAEPLTPESASTTPEAPDTKGEPPAWRWQDILKNAREATAKETEARVRQELEARLKPYEGVDEATLNGYRILQAAERGDVQARQRVSQVNPTLAQAMGWVKPATADPEPEPDLQTGEGTPVFSAPQLQKWQQWNQRKLMAEFRQEIQPLQRTAQTIQQREAASQAHHEASQAIAAFANDPDFTPDNKKACGEEIAKDPRLQKLADVDPAAALELAWSRVKNTKVIPQKFKEAEGKTLAHLQQRAVAATTNPATASTTTPTNTVGNARAALDFAAQSLGAA